MVTQLEFARQELLEARNELATKDAQIDVLRRRVSSTRLALRLARSQLAELRDLITPDLAMRLVETSMRLESRDGIPPLHNLHRAARIVQELEVTRPPSPV